MSRKNKEKTVNVYGPKGEHEVTSWANARDMVRNCGWSLEPFPEKKVAPKPRRGSKAAKDAAADELAGAVESSGQKPDHPRKKLLESMTRSDLVHEAKSAFDYALDEKRSTDYMVWVIQQLRGGLSVEEVDKKMEDEFGPGWGLPLHVYGGAGDSPSDQVSFVTPTKIAD